MATDAEKWERKWRGEPEIATSLEKHQIERDPRTDKITAVCGKVVYVVVLPDWFIQYVEFKTEEEKVTIRRVLVREEGVQIVKVTDRRIYFEE